MAHPVRRPARLPSSALVLALVFVAAGCGGGDSDEESASQLKGTAGVVERYDGIEQNGGALGSPDAPWTLVEFVDLQCPFCAAFDRDVLPALIDEFVRTGKLRMELRPVSFLGPDSSTGASAAAAAGQQDRMWQFADLFYRNQGPENSGYATPEFIGGIAESIPGLDFEKFQAASGTPELVAELERHARAAKTAGITGTPNFRFGRTGEALTPFQPHGLKREQFLAALRRRIG